MFAAEEAIRWYDRALESTGATGGDPPQLLIAEAALSRGEACEQLGRFAEARADYERAIAIARSSGPGRKWLEARALSALAHVLWNEDRYEEGERILPEALAAAQEAGLQDLESKLLYTAGSMSFGRGDWERARAFHERALAVADRQGDLEGEAHARHGLTETRFFIGPFDEALRQGLEADRLLRQLGQRPMVYHNGYMVGFSYLLLGRPVEAQRVIEESVAGCREVGNLRDLGFALSARSFERLMRGELGAALTSADEAVDIAIKGEAPRLEITVRAWRMLVLAELDATERLAQDLSVALELHGRLGGAFLRGPLLAYRGWTLLRGEPAAARSSFEEAAADASLTGRLLAGRIEIAAADRVREPDGLRSASERLFEGSDGVSPPFAAWARYGLARSAAIHGDGAEAVRRAREAVRAADDAGDAAVGVRASALVAAVLAASGDAGAEAAREEATSRVLRVSEGIDDEELRAGFLGRRDLEEVDGR